MFRSCKISHGVICCRGLHWRVSCVYLARILFIVVTWQNLYCVRRVHICTYVGAEWVFNRAKLKYQKKKKKVEPTQRDTLLITSKWRPRFQTFKRRWVKQYFNHGFRLRPKPRTNDLASTSRNVLDWTRAESVFSCIVRRRYQATTSEAVLDWEDSVFSSHL
jgi:hypothetical protein